MTIPLDRRSVLLGAGSMVLAGSARSQGAPEPQRVPNELVGEALELEAAVEVGNPHGDVTVVEFFDYNCPWCKKSAADLDALLRSEPELSYVLVNFAVLGAPSVQATRVALGYLDVYGPKRYPALHHALFGLRGVVDGRRALAQAEALGADVQRVTAVADSDKTTKRMTEALRVGNSLGLTATPSFVIGPEAYIGAVTLEQKHALIARARA